MTAPQLFGRAETDGGLVTDCILEAVAEVVDEDPLAFDQPLYEAIDPDALDALVRSGGAGITIEFEYLGTEVVVHGDGQVDVTEARD
jgi:hypothetical protein